MGFGCCVLPGFPVAHAIFNFPDGFVARLRPFGMGNQACPVGVSNLTPGWECPVGARLLSTGQVVFFPLLDSGSARPRSRAALLPTACSVLVGDSIANTSFVCIDLTSILVAIRNHCGSLKC